MLRRFCVSPSTDIDNVVYDGKDDLRVMLEYTNDETEDANTKAVQQQHDVGSASARTGRDINR